MEILKKRMNHQLYMVHCNSFLTILMCNLVVKAEKDRKRSPFQTLACSGNKGKKLLNYEISCNRPSFNLYNWAAQFFNIITFPTIQLSSRGSISIFLILHCFVSTLMVPIIDSFLFGVFHRMSTYIFLGWP